MMRFEVGSVYELQNGDRITIVERSGDYILGSDGVWRYDRMLDPISAGRVTGTNHDYSDPRNIKRFRALIVPNLLDVIEEYFKADSLHRLEPEFLALCDRIQGKEVDLTFIGEDAFEWNDNNWLLPACCWSKV